MQNKNHHIVTKDMPFTIRTLEGETMVLNKNPAPKRHISYSSASDFLRCRRYFYWKRIANLGGHASLAMNFGGALHLILARHYAGMELTADDYIEVAEEKSLPAKEKHSLQLLVSTMINYAHNWSKNGDLRPIMHEGLPLVECGAEFPLEGTSWNVMAKMDLIGEMQSGSRWLVDHKSSSKSFNRTTAPPLQREIYLEALKWAGIAVTGYMENQIILTKIPQFLRFTVIFGDTERCLGELREIVGEIERLEFASSHSQDHHAWIRNTTWCDMFGSCAYKALCASRNPEKLFRNYERKDPSQRNDTVKWLSKA